MAMLSLFFSKCYCADLSYHVKTSMNEVTGSFTMMGTFVDIKIRTTDFSDKQAKNIIKSAYAEMQQLVKLVNRYDVNSDVSKINRAAGKKAVTVDKSVILILARANEISELTRGALDVSYLPLGELWKKSAAKSKLPTNSQIIKAKKIVGYKKIIIDEANSCVFLTEAGMKIDLGAIAKGSVIDGGAACLKENGVKDFLINAGGDIRTSCEDFGDWVVGLTNPINKTGPVLDKMSLCNKAIATSGDYEKFVEIEGKKYNHIINPKTGQPAQLCSSVTVMADSAQLADVVSTAVFILGPVEGLALCRQLNNVEALIIDRDLNITKTEMFPE